MTWWRGVGLGFRKCGLRPALPPFLTLTLVFLGARQPGTSPSPEAPQTNQEQPPPLSEQPALVVGTKVCKACHPAIYNKWDHSRHSKMVQPATLKCVKGDFGVQSVKLRGERYGLRVSDGTYYISESHFTGKKRQHRVDYTLGNRRIQHYLTTLEDGRIIVLPPSWDVLRQEWFHNMDIVGPEDDEQVPVQLWNKNCFGCHVSEERKKFNVVEKTYATEWLEFGTICERCHGPASRHVDRYVRLDLYGNDPNNYIVLQTRLDNVTNSMVCAQCHSFRDMMALGYTAGQDYFDFFFPLLEYSQAPSKDPVWWPDGKTRRFSTNTLGIWQSQCFLRGKVACTSCHIDMHDPEIEKNSQLRPTNNALCTRCHVELQQNVSAHTHHPETSLGSSCVECHMPRTVVGIKATMRDHSISIPAPGNTARFGVPNACNNACHEDKTAEWALGALEKWYPGSTADEKVIRRAEAFTGGRNRDPEALAPLIALAENDSEGPIPRANAVGYLSSYSAPGVLPVLLRAAEADHPLIRAVATLKLGEVAELDISRIEATLVQALHDPRRIVRMNAAMSLLNLGVNRLEGPSGEAFERAKQLHVIRAAFLADDAPSQFNMGKFHFLNGRPDRAAQAFETSLHLDPKLEGAKYFMALAYLLQRQTDTARKLLKEVKKPDPYAKPAKELLKKLEN
ncbi:MAG: HEAT repeat domain-containing protein [Acidobacteriota bacterium]